MTSPPSLSLNPNPDQELMAASANDLKLVKEELTRVRKEAEPLQEAVRTLILTISLTLIGG